MPWQCCNGQRSLEGQHLPSGTGASSPLGQNWGNWHQIAFYYLFKHQCTVEIMRQPLVCRNLLSLHIPVPGRTGRHPDSTAEKEATFGSGYCDILLQILQCNAEYSLKGEDLESSAAKNVLNV